MYKKTNYMSHQGGYSYQICIFLVSHCCKTFVHAFNLYLFRQISCLTEY